MCHPSSQEHAADRAAHEDSAIGTIAGGVVTTAAEEITSRLAPSCRLRDVVLTPD
jgi:hypothetical protein